MTEPLNGPERTDALADLAGWREVEGRDAIRKEFNFATFIEAFGSMLCEQGRRVAVLAVDPSSSVTRGSILGDKTRMARLAVSDDAFIRPSPSAGTSAGSRERRQAAGWEGVGRT